MNTDRILVVDDNDDHRNAVQFILEKHNYNVVTTTKGKEGLKILNEQSDIRILIVDLVMLDTSGVDILERVKNYNHPLRRIVLTGHDGQLPFHEAKELKVFAFLGKPVANNSLLFAIESAFNDIRNEELKHKAQAFQGIARLLIESHDLQEILDFIAEKSLELLKGYTCHIRTLEEETRSLILKAGKGPYMKIADIRRKIGVYGSGKVAQKGESIVIKKLQEEEYFNRLKKDFLGKKKVEADVQAYLKTAKSAIIAPIKRDKKVIGIINMTSDKENYFGKPEIETLENFADQVSIAITIAEIQKKSIEDEKFSALGRIMGDLAHIIENEAAKIRVIVKDILPGIPETDPKKRLMQLIMQRAQYLIDTKRGIASPLTEPRPEEIPVEVLTKEIKNLLETMKQESVREHISHELDFPTALSPVHGDIDRLRKVFEHLVKNSYEAMKDKGGSLKISATTDESNEFLNILFEDTGKGIKKQARNKLFASFYSTKPGGLGYGLWYCKQTMLNMKGDVFLLDTNNHEGVTICVKIPVYTGEGE